MVMVTDTDTNHKKCGQIMKICCVEFFKKCNWKYFSQFIRKNFNNWTMQNASFIFKDGMHTFLHLGMAELFSENIHSKNILKEGYCLHISLNHPKLFNGWFWNSAKKHLFHKSEKNQFFVEISWIHDTCGTCVQRVQRNKQNVKTSSSDNYGCHRERSVFSMIFILKESLSHSPYVI